MKNKKGFTLAEILITLTVIGIIAAITINIINTNVKEAEVVAKLKKTMSVLNGAMYRASIEHGPAYNWAETNNIATTGETFLTKYIAPYLITTKPVQKISLKNIGYKKGIKTVSGSAFGALNNTSAILPRAFLNDGTVLLNLNRSLGYTGAIEYSFSIDINGPKGPNIAGRDVFEVGINVTSTVPTVKMAGMTEVVTNEETGQREYSEVSNEDLIENCKTKGKTCGALIQKNGWKIPRDYPVKL